MIPLSLSIQHPLFSPYWSYNDHSHPQKTRIRRTILCSRINRRRHGFVRSTKQVLESACIIASSIGMLPEPLDLLLREFGGANGGGNGGGSGSWNGFGWGPFDGSRKRKKWKWKLGIVGILIILGVGLWLVLGKELVIDDVLLGASGLLLFALSIDGWRRGAKDWILGFSCCAVLMTFLRKKENIDGCVWDFRNMKLNRRRKWRLF